MSYDCLLGRPFLRVNELVMEIGQDAFTCGKEIKSISSIPIPSNEHEFREGRKTKYVHASMRWDVKLSRKAYIYMRRN